MASLATLFSLPVELLHQISNQLSYSSHIAFSFTCRELYFKLDTRRRLPASSPQGKAYIMEDLLEMEEWPEQNPPHPTFNVYLVNFMACRICLKLRSRTKFCTFFHKYFYSRRNASEDHAEDIMKRKLGQVCLPCSFANGIYDFLEENGWFMTQGGVYWRMCDRCDEFNQELSSFSEELVCGSCKDVLEAETKDADCRAIVRY